ncbi:MAG: hypothetical protein [Caudoviricetes sp.]|nr:MAG: hypothetical protein [Caudoviricetes sp.]
MKCIDEVALILRDAGCPVKIVNTKKFEHRFRINGSASFLFDFEVETFQIKRDNLVDKVFGSSIIYLYSAAKTKNGYIIQMAYIM